MHSARSKHRTYQWEYKERGARASFVAVEAGCTCVCLNNSAGMMSLAFSLSAYQRFPASYSGLGPNSGALWAGGVSDCHMGVSLLSAPS